MTEFLTGFADGRCVNNRKILINVANQKFKVQRLVACVNTFKYLILVDRSFVRTDDVGQSFNLLVKGANSRRKKTSQTVFISFFFCKGAAFVHPRVS